MNYNRLIRNIAFSLLLLPATLEAQPMGSGIYGMPNDQLIFSATLMPNGRTRMAGLTRTALPSTSPSNGYLIEEAAAPFGDVLSSFTYNQGVESFSIRSIDAHPTNGTMAAVALSKPGTQTHNDAVFMDLSATMAVTQARIWNSTSSETPNKVKVLADGSYVIVGKFVTPVDGNSRSFVTRLAAAPSYAPVFHRVLGRTDVAKTLDEAIAVEQLPDGRLLVLGQTFHFARTSEGSIYLAVLSLTGNIDAFRVFQLESTVKTPRPKDMAIMADGSVIIVGRTTDASGNGALNGFVMKVAADLSSATCLEMVQPSGASFNEELNAIVRIPSLDRVAIVGNVSVVTQGVTHLDPLIISMDNNLNLLTTFRSSIAGTANAFYLDVLLRDNGTIAEAVGVTDQVPSGTTSDGQNVFLVRYPVPNLTICGGTNAALNLVPKSVSMNIVSPINSTTMSVITGSIARTPVTTTETVGCFTLKTDFEAEAETKLETALFPNPASGSATLRIADLEGVAKLRLTDISGRIVRQLETLETETEIDLAGLAPGLYLLGISTKDAQITKKLIIE